MTTPTRMTIRTAANVPTPAPIIVQVTVSAFCCASVTRLVLVVASIFGCVQSHCGYVPVLSVPGVGHSVLLTSVLGHVQSHSRGGHVGLVLSGYVPGVGHSVLHTSVLGHVQSHSRGGHVVCSSTSVGTVAHCGVVGETISSGRLSVFISRGSGQVTLWVLGLATYSTQILHFCYMQKFCRFHAHNQLA